MLGHSISVVWASAHAASESAGVHEPSVDERRRPIRLTERISAAVKEGVDTETWRAMALFVQVGRDLPAIRRPRVATVCNDIGPVGSPGVFCVTRNLAAECGSRGKSGEKARA